MTQKESISKSRLIKKRSTCQKGGVYIKEEETDEEEEHM